MMNSKEKLESKKLVLQELMSDYGVASQTGVVTKSSPDEGTEIEFGGITITVRAYPYVTSEQKTKFVDALASFIEREANNAVEIVSIRENFESLIAVMNSLLTIFVNEFGVGAELKIDNEEGEEYDD
jgi:hypothetical protein